MRANKCFTIEIKISSNNKFVVFYLHRVYVGDSIYNIIIYQTIQLFAVTVTDSAENFTRSKFLWNTKKTEVLGRCLERFQKYRPIFLRKSDIKISLTVSRKLTYTHSRKLTALWRSLCISLEHNVKYTHIWIRVKQIEIY